MPLLNHIYQDLVDGEIIDVADILAHSSCVHKINCSFSRQLEVGTATTIRWMVQKMPSNKFASRHECVYVCGGGSPERTAGLNSTLIADVSSEFVKLKVPGGELTDPPCR